MQISSITFYAKTLKDASFGEELSLPDYVKNNHGVANASSDNNVCFSDLWLFTKVPTNISVSVKPKNI